MKPALACAVVLVPAIAAADVPDDSGPVPDARLRLDAGASFTMGNLAIAHHDDLAGGVALALGARYDRVMLALDAGLLGTYSHREAGEMQRGPYAWWAMLAPRYSAWTGRVARTLKHHPETITSYERGDLWLELGAGAQLVEPPDGPAVWRDTLSLGIVLEQTAIRGDHHSSGELGLRVFWLRDPSTGATDDQVLVSLGVTLGS